MVPKQRCANRTVKKEKAHCNNELSLSSPKRVINNFERYNLTICYSYKKNKSTTSLLWTWIDFIEKDFSMTLNGTNCHCLAHLFVLLFKQQ